MNAVVTAYRCNGSGCAPELTMWFVILFITVPLIGYVLNGILSLFETKPEPLVCATCKQVVYELPGVSTTCRPCHDKARP